MTGTVDKVPTRAVVTGATGLLGSRLVGRLLDGGGEVVALVRDGERAQRLLPRHPALRIVPGDINDLDSYRRHLAGAAAVFHTAAYFREYNQPGHDLALLDRTNVGAVEQLLYACADAAVPVVVHVSSLGVLGLAGRAAGPGGPDGTVLVDEDGPSSGDRQPNAYWASKVRAEAVVDRCVERTGLRVPLVLPASMWGPGDAGPTPAGRLFLSVARGELRAAPRAGNHVVDARDVAATCVRAAESGQSGRRYLVAGGWWGFPELFAAIAAVTGRPAPRPVPGALALTVATALEWQARLRGRPPVARRAAVKMLLDRDRLRYTSARAERELGARFRPIEQTLADQAAWYREQGLLPQPVRM